MTILTDKNQRIVIWGAEIKDDTVYGDLVFFGSNLGTSITVNDSGKNYPIKIAIPTFQQRQILTAKATKITFKRI